MIVDYADTVFLGGAKCPKCASVADYAAHVDAFRCRKCGFVDGGWRQRVISGSVVGAGNTQAPTTGER